MAEATGRIEGDNGAPALADPDPPLADGLVRLRARQPADLPCVRAASEEGRIPEGTTVPEVFTEAAGSAWIERQHSRTRTGV